MLTYAQVLEPLARCRTDEIVITTMSTVRPWGLLSHHDLDLASVDSAMGHAADLALGIAIARPERTVLCLNGDGSMLMSLGTLVTIGNVQPPNLVLFVIDNGTYEITGNQSVPGAGRIDYAAMARATGWPRSFRFDNATLYDAGLDEILMRGRGPTLVSVAVQAGAEGPITRGPHEKAAYLQVSLAESVRRVKARLTRVPLPPTLRTPEG